tara:strand:- start:19481 stop:20836 length:1356 start_codon:yes stop_codon:yes gene_type:complete
MSKTKSLGIWSLIALVVGNMIGSGIFLLPSALAHIGTISLVGWICTAIGAMFIALVFARLASNYPMAGGPYAYAKEAYGEFIGFQVAFNYWCGLWIGNAAIAVAFTGYLSFFFPALKSHHIYGFLTSAGALWAVTLVNMSSVKNAGGLQIISTILKLIPLLLIGFVGIFFIHPHNLFDHANLIVQTKHPVSAFAAISAAAMMTMWAFIGLEGATVPAQHVKNPKKLIPRATIIGTSITAVVYILSATAIMGILPIHELAQSASPYADAGKLLFGNWMGIIVAGCAVISTLGALNGWVMLHAQVPYAVAQDNLFPKVFGKLSKRDTPVNGLIISGILATAVMALNFQQSLVSQFEFVIMLATLAGLIPYLYCTLAELLIVRKYMTKGTKSGYIIGIIAFLYICWAIMSAGKEIIYLGMGLMIISLAVYAWIKINPMEELKKKEKFPWNDSFD